jgi:abortive infection bacteriophage resistance protein
MVNYYRLSGYLYPFRRTESDAFMEGETLSVVWRRYCFDRRLRVLVLDAIGRVEVAVRTQLVFHFAHQYGPFGHCSEENLPKLKVEQYIGFRENLLTETSRSKEAFKTHFKEKYGDEHRNLPIWMVCELMSVGSLLTFFKGTEDEIQRKVAQHFGLADKLLVSWLQSLYAVRNICAHHARLWNRQLGNAPVKPQKNKFPAWHHEDNNGKPLFSHEQKSLGFRENVTKREVT